MSAIFYARGWLFLLIGLVGLFLPGLGFAQGWGDAGQEAGSVERKLRRRGPVEILILQSVDHPVSRQIKQGFQERLAEEKGLQEPLAGEEGLGAEKGLREDLREEKGLRFSSLSKEGLQFRCVTYDLKGKFAHSRVLAQLLNRKEADLVLAIGASAAQTAVLASRLKEQIGPQGGSEEAMEAQIKKKNPESKAAEIQTSAAQTAVLASKLKTQITTDRGESEAVEVCLSPAREEIITQCGLEGEKAETQANPKNLESEAVEIQTVLAPPTPIVFTAVMDPFYLHILPKNRPDGPLGPVYGVLDPPPLQEQLRLIRLVMPGLERLGVVYSEDAVAVVKLIEDLKEMAPVFGIDVLAVPIRSLEGVAGAYTALAPEVDAFFMPLDDRLLVQVDLILALAHKAYVPVFASDTASVEKGALAALGYNYHEASRMAAELALRALKAKNLGAGRSREDLPQLVQQKQRLTLNQKTARRLRIVFPASALREADSILD